MRFLPHNFTQILSIFALGILAMCSGATEAMAACKCPTKPGLKASFDASASVVVGRVEEQKNNPLKPKYTEVRVTILKRFKNDGELRREVLYFYTPDNKDACGIKFQPGFEYLIFVSGNPAFYKTDSCSRTEVLENAQVDIHRLAKLAK